MIRRVAVIGLGLMGGSLARALTARGVEVWGHDADPDSLRRAAAEGVVTRALDDSLAGAEEAEVVVLAVPVDAAAALLARLAPRLGGGCAVTDVGSTKRSIVAAAQRLGIADRFVGSHPLAGDHRSGWEAGRADLFAGATVYLTPTADARPGALERVRSLWSELGAITRPMDAAEHDRLLAWSSHLPQLASTALALALARAGVPRDGLGPGGRDATRLAGSSPAMWTAVCLDNAEPLRPAIDALIARLEGLRAAIGARDAAALRADLDAARGWAEAATPPANPPAG